MNNETINAAKIVALNGGVLVGKTRLQKTAYFLEALDLGFGFDFDYYHYGPYSEDLSIASDDAKTLNLLETEWKSTFSGNEYAEFRSKQDFDFTDELSSKQKCVLNIIKKYDSISLELAATADFLRKNGYQDSSWEETKQRKSTKATSERISKAKKLLQELKLEI